MAKYQKIWTKEEVEYLKKYFEKKSIKQMCKDLKRSRGSIMAKIYNLKLSKDTVNVVELERQFKLHRSIILKKWIKERKLPCKKISTRWKIRLEDFWKWAEKNQDIIPFYNLEKNILGVEKVWVDKARVERKLSLRTCQRWSNLEVSKLKMYVKQGKTKKEIALLLNRSISSIAHKLRELNLQYVVSDRKIEILWKDIETNHLIDELIKGIKMTIISEDLGRTYAMTAHKVSRLMKNNKLIKLDNKFFKVDINNYK